MMRWLKIAVPAAIAALLLIQLVPYGRAHDNPPVSQAAKFPTPGGEQLMTQHCGDCHSNLTDWRWYSNIAPASWLVTNDVNGGREHLNFSEWNKPQPPLDEVLHAIEGGDMPPLKYTLPHPNARLDAQSKKRLIAAITALYAKDPPTIRPDRGGH